MEHVETPLRIRDSKFDKKWPTSPLSSKQLLYAYMYIIGQYVYYELYIYYVILFNFIFFLVLIFSFGM